MEIIGAVAAFVVLFALWVIVPRYFIQRKENADSPNTAISQDQAVPTPSPAD